MACTCARKIDEGHGWRCSVTGEGCMFLHPDSKLCAAVFGEGPDVDAVEQSMDSLHALFDEDPSRKENYLITT